MKPEVIKLLSIIVENEQNNNSNLNSDKELTKKGIDQKTIDEAFTAELIYGSRKGGRTLTETGYLLLNTAELNTEIKIFNKTNKEHSEKMDRYTKAILLLAFATIVINLMLIPLFKDLDISTRLVLGFIMSVLLFVLMYLVMEDVLPFHKIGPLFKELKNIKEVSKMKKRNLLINVSEIISVICFTQIIILALPCAKKGLCEVPSKLFWIIPNSRIMISIVAFIGVGSFLLALYLKWGKLFFKKIRNYGIDAIFLIIALTFINKVIYPIILLSLNDFLFESFRWAILLTGLSIMIIFWQMKDDLKVKV